MAEAGDLYLGDLTSGGASVALVIPPQMGGDYATAAVGAAPCYATAYAELQTRWPLISTLEPADRLICPVAAASCPEEMNGVTLRSDGLHYTQAGAEIVITWLLDRLQF